MLHDGAKSGHCLQDTSQCCWATYSTGLVIGGWTGPRLGAYLCRRTMRCGQKICSFHCGLGKQATILYWWPANRLSAERPTGGSTCKIHVIIMRHVRSGHPHIKLVTHTASPLSSKLHAHVAMAGAVRVPRIVPLLLEGNISPCTWCLSAFWCGANVLLSVKIYRVVPTLCYPTPLYNDITTLQCS